MCISSYACFFRFCTTATWTRASEYLGISRCRGSPSLLRLAVAINFRALDAAVLSQIRANDEISDFIQRREQHTEKAKRGSWYWLLSNKCVGFSHFELAVIYLRKLDESSGVSSVIVFFFPITNCEKILTTSHCTPIEALVATESLRYKSICVNLGYAAYEENL